MKGDATPDAHFAAVMGEFGCWVDPGATRLTQSGLENSRVPELDAFLGISKSSLHTLRQFLTVSGRKEPLLSAEVRNFMVALPDSPFTQIRDFMTATLHPVANEYKLAVTLLITGNAGVGKQTMVRWTSRDLGFHVMEVRRLSHSCSHPDPSPGGLLRRG